MKLNKKLETQLVLYSTLSNNQVLLNELNKTIKERDTLIDDIAVLKANDDRYRKRAENAMDYAERSQCEVLRLKQENKDLRLQADTYFDEWQKSKLKAQAFDRIDEVYGDSDLYSDEYVLETIQEQIDGLEKK